MTTNSIVPGSKIVNEGRSNNYQSFKDKFFSVKTFEVLDNTGNLPANWKNNLLWSVTLFPRLLVLLTKLVLGTSIVVPASLALGTKLSDVYNNWSIGADLKNSASKLAQRAAKRALPQDAKLALQKNPLLRDELQSAHINFVSAEKAFVELTISRTQSLPFDKKLELYNDAIDLAIHVAKNPKDKDADALIPDKQVDLRNNLVDAFYGELVKQASAELSGIDLSIPELEKRASAILNFDSTKTLASIKNDILLDLKARIGDKNLTDKVAYFTSESAQVSTNPNHDLVKARREVVLVAKEAKEKVRDQLQTELPGLQDAYKKAFDEYTKATPGMAIPTGIDANTFLNPSNPLIKTISEQAQKNAASAATDAMKFYTVITNLVQTGSKVAANREQFAKVDLECFQMWEIAGNRADATPNLAKLQGDIVGKNAERLAALEAIQKAAVEVVAPKKPVCASLTAEIEVADQLLIAVMARGANALNDFAGIAPIIHLKIEQLAAAKGTPTYYNYGALNAGVKPAVVEAVLSYMADLRKAVV